MPRNRIIKRAIMGTVAFWTVALAFAFVLVTTGFADGIPSRTARIGAPHVMTPAETPYSYTGLYLGGGVGGGAALHELDINFGKGSNANIDSLASYALLGDLRVGFDWHIANGPLLVGVFAGYQFGEMEFNASAPNVALNGTVERDWYAGGRLGLVFANKTLVYGGYIYQPADLDVSLSNGDSFSGSLSPHNIIGGMEFPLAGGFTLAMEYKYTLPESNTFEGVRVETDVHEGTLRLNWRPAAGLFN